MMYELLWFFFLYAFIGWCCEVGFAAVTRGSFVNRGFLNGPLCPIYGVGLVLVVGLLEPLKDNLLVLYFGSVLLTSAVELLTGFVLEKLFSQRWWDYSNMPFNLGGYICLKASLLWGLACILIVHVFHPLIAGLVQWLPLLLGRILLAGFCALLLVDLVATVRTVLKLNQQLQQIDELAARIKQASNQLGENIAENVLEWNEKGQEVREDWLEAREDWQEKKAERKEERQEERDQRQLAREASWQKLREELEHARGQSKTLLRQRFFGKHRLLDAFPNLRSTKHQEALEQMRQEWQAWRAERKEGKKQP